MVLGRISILGVFFSLTGYSVELKRVFTSVDLPRPDSPNNDKQELRRSGEWYYNALTNNHDIEVETFSETFAMILVRQVREADVTC